ncbi:uncharacterized protein CC84DRAFT_1187379 [Paraphaeosphaeria sporulosa]|uniref:DNA recombination and repair protein Rad51-like C-terminal domain-containing protein n=1 Tax=Paraphaeosphaeria sporulosa TaxID=1460663 RepID=A0A177CI01_9PLEO|nr:uncharacterized protein CC84DRAFT_1187379 [Paraphaeosphaeria sporulosa]OAG06498.1 hypothetical protein CC84DRAFT_1187379 [Paraphaeosphaeria sporulosa]
MISGNPVLAKSQGVLKTDSKSIDAAFGGGLEGGRVVGVWGDAGGGGAEISLALLSSSLLENPHSSAAVVDTTGNFDVFRLYAFIFARLQDDVGILRSLNEAMSMDGLGAEEVAAKALDRVNIMRAFDLVGVMEAVGEVRDELEGRNLQAIDEVEGGSVDPPEAEVVVTGLGEQRDAEKEKEKEMPKRTFVADSDEEEELLFDDEPAAPISTDVVMTETSPTEEQDEILFVDGSADQRDDTSHLPAVVTAPHVQPTGAEQSPSKRDPAPARTAFLLIDNLAHVVSPLLQKDYTQAQALISSFLLTLSHLTRNHTLHTLLSNPSVPPRPSSRKPNPNHENQQQPPPPSIFASNKNVPALVSLLIPYLDLSLLVEKMPYRKVDARAVYADGEAVKRARKGIEMVSVMEVMSDRWGGRGGGWGTFVCGERGLRDV